MQTIEQWQAEAMWLADEYGRCKWDEGLADGAFDALGRRRFREEARETFTALSAHLATHPGRQEDAKDAARYRWLRNECEKHDGLTIAKVGVFDLEPWSGDCPDREIDAAMAMPKEPTHD